MKSALASVMLLGYRPGSHFAQSYIGWKLCRQPRIVGAVDLPEDSRALAAGVAAANAQYSQNTRFRADVGEVAFQCGKQSGLTRAGTALASPAAGGGIAIWSAPLLASYVVDDPAQSELGKYVMNVVLASFRYDPQWQKRFNELTSQVTGQVIADQNQLLRAVQERAHQQASASGLNHPNTFSPSSHTVKPADTTGNIHVCDGIGRCGTVANDYNEYYMDHSGNIRGTSSGPPDNTGVWSPMHKQ